MFCLRLFYICPGGQQQSQDKLFVFQDKETMLQVLKIVDKANGFTYGVDSIFICKCDEIG